MTDKEVMKIALDALDYVGYVYTTEEENKEVEQATDALRTALAQPDLEPVAYFTKRKVSGTEGLLRADMVDISAKNKETHDFIPLYTSPPKKEWVGLTDEDIQGIHYQIKAKGMGAYSTEDIYRAIEAKLKDKNT